MTDDGNKFLAIGADDEIRDRAVDVTTARTMSDGVESARAHGRARASLFVLTATHLQLMMENSWCPLGRERVTTNTQSLLFQSNLRHEKISFCKGGSVFIIHYGSYYKEGRFP